MLAPAGTPPWFSSREGAGPGTATSEWSQTRPCSREDWVQDNVLAARPRRSSC